AGMANKGFFRMLYSRHRSTEHLSYRAAIRPYACAGELFVIDIYRQLAKEMLERSAAEIFGATDGQTFVDFELYTLPDANVNLPFDPSWNCGGAPCNVRLMPCSI